MSDGEYLTESKAAALIGWSTSNLRSHRLRHEAELLAQGLSDHDRDLVLRVRKHGAQKEPRLSDGYEGPALFRRCGEAWELTQQGLEVSRRIGHVGRRAPPPPPAIVKPGRVRYERAAVEQWLAEHPEIAEASKRRRVSWGYRETAREIGVEVGTLRTLVSRAQSAQRDLEAMGEPSSPEERDERARLTRQAGNAPPWIWAGARRRWIPVEVRAWMATRTEGPDPLLRKPDPERGPLLPEPEARERMNVCEATMRGYRARARAALRRLMEAGKRPPEALTRDRRRARAHPPYVIQEGQRLYHERDIAEWVEQRGRRDL